MTDREPYWFTALKDMTPVGGTWGSHKIYKDLAQLHEVALHTMIAAFLGSREEDIEYRRTLLYHYLAGPYSTDSESDILRMHRHKLPINTFLPKAVDNLFIAYNEDPVRTWKVAGENDDTTSQRLTAAYDAAGANGRLQENGRYALAHGGTLVRWYVAQDGRMALEILTPNLCRYETHPQFPDVLTKVVKPLLITKIDPTTGEPTTQTETICEVWTDEALYYTDAVGVPISYQDDAGNVIGPEGLANHYGRIPYVVCRLHEPNDNSVFGGGLFPLVEGNLGVNEKSWLADLSSEYEGAGHWVFVNMGMDVGVKLGFGRVTLVDGIQGSQEAAPPSADFISGSGAYDRLEEHAEKREKRLLRALGLPDSVIDSQAGDPPSGISRKLERKELEELRKGHVLMLSRFEQKLSDLFCVVYNRDVALTRKVANDGTVTFAPAPGVIPFPEPGTPKAAILSITFQPEKIVEEPEKEDARNDALFEKGLLSPAEYVEAKTGRHFTTDEEAIQFILKNRAAAELLNGPVTDATIVSETPSPDMVAPTPIDINTAPNDVPALNGVA